MVDLVIEPEKEGVEAELEPASEAEAEAEEEDGATAAAREAMPFDGELAL